MSGSTLDELQKRLAKVDQEVDGVKRIAELAKIRSLVWKANREIDAASAAVSAAQQRQAELVQKRDNLKQVLKAKQLQIELSKQAGTQVAEKLDLQPVEQYLERFPDHRTKFGEQLLRLRVEDEKAQRMALAIQLYDKTKAVVNRRDEALRLTRRAADSRDWKVRKKGQSIRINPELTLPEDIVQLGKWADELHSLCTNSFEGLQDGLDDERLE